MWWKEINCLKWLIVSLGTIIGFHGISKIFAFCCILYILCIHIAVIIFEVKVTVSIETMKIFLLFKCIIFVYIHEMTKWRCYQGNDIKYFCYLAFSLIYKESNDLRSHATYQNKTFLRIWKKYIFSFSFWFFHCMTFACIAD